MVKTIRHSFLLSRIYQTLSMKHKVVQLLFLAIFFASCSRSPEELIYGEYQWTQRNEDGTRDQISILPDGTFIQMTQSEETKGVWKEVTEFGEYTLWTSQADNDWDASLVMFTYPDGREQYYMLNTPFDEWGNCRSTFRQRIFQPIDTMDSRIVGSIGMNFFGKKVDITDKNFPGCSDADISRVYKTTIEDNDYREIGTAQVEIEYDASTGNGTYVFSAQWEPQYRRFMPTNGQGRIYGDTLYDSRLGTVALGYLDLDDECCDHRVHLVVGNSLQSFR